VLGEFVTGHSRKCDSRAGHTAGFLSEEEHSDKYHNEYSPLLYTAECHRTGSV
jgi:hypothetical protein